MRVQFVVNATHQLISLRWCCSWNVVINVHGYTTQTGAGLDDARVGFHHMSRIYCLHVMVSRDASQTAANSRTIIATEPSHLYKIWGFCCFFQHILTPSASNTAACSLTLHFKVWHCSWPSHSIVKNQRKGELEWLDGSYTGLSPQTSWSVSWLCTRLELFFFFLDLTRRNATYCYSLKLESTETKRSHSTSWEPEHVASL